MLSFGTLRVKILFGLFSKGGLNNESKIVSKTDLRQVQSHQEKREDQNYL